MSPRDHQPGPQPSTGAAPPCLMLVPRGFDAPLDLVQGLDRRGIAVEEIGDAPAVMVALAARRYLSLVLVEPAAVLELQELVDAVRRYHEPLPLWQYAADAQPRLARLSAPGRQQPRHQGHATAAEGAEGAAAEDVPQPHVFAAAAGVHIDLATRHRGPAQADNADINTDISDTPAPADLSPASCPAATEVSGRIDGRPPHRQSAEEPYSRRSTTQPPADTEQHDAQVPPQPEVRVTLTDEELAMLLDHDAADGSEPADDHGGFR